MGTRHLSSAFVFLLLAAGPVRAEAPAYDCEEVEVTSLEVPGKVTAQLCFLKVSQKYFLSNDCLTMKCPLLAKMKEIKFKSSEEDRPGTAMCKQLGGAVDTVTIKNRGEFHRCVSPTEPSTISLNLLESWNGKVFVGPGKVDNSF